MRMKLFSPIAACGEDTSKVKAIVLDLDNTLIYCDINASGAIAPTSPTRVNHFWINLDGHRYQVKVRPGLDAFLIEIRKMFDKVIVWSAGVRPYVDAVVENIFRSVGYMPDLVWARENCDEVVPGQMYTKPLVNLITAGMISKISEVVIFDDLRTSMSNNLENAIHVPEFMGRYDSYLYSLIKALTESSMTLRDITSINLDLSMTVGPVNMSVRSRPGSIQRSPISLSLNMRV